MIEVKALFVLKANVEAPQVIDGLRGKKWLIPVTGGSFNGERLSGVLQAGGSDFQLICQDGVAELDVRVTLRTDDDVTIELKGHGMRHATSQLLERIMAGEDVDASEYYFREALFSRHPRVAMSG